MRSYIKEYSHIFILTNYQHTINNASILKVFSNFALTKRQISYDKIP